MGAFVCDYCGGKLKMQAGSAAACKNCGMCFSKERLLEMIKERESPILDSLERSAQVSAESETCAAACEKKDECQQETGQTAAKSAQSSADTNELATVYRIKTHLEEIKDEFYACEDLHLEISKFSSRSYWIVIIVATIIEMFIFSQLQWPSGVPLFDRYVWMANDLLSPMEQFWIMLDTIVIICAIGMLIYIFINRVKKKSHLEAMEKELRIDYDNNAASTFLPYELYHPYTVDKIIEWMKKGFSSYEATEELKKDSTLKKIVYHDYAKVESLLARGQVAWKS